MTDGSPKINGNKVVCSGSAVFHQRDVFEVYPTPNDSEYRVQFEIQHADDAFGRIETLAGRDNKTAVIRITKHFSSLGGFSSSEPIVIGIEDDNLSEYVVSFFLQTSGTFESHTLILHYTFTQRPLSGEWS